MIDDFFPSLTLSVDWSKDTANLGNKIKPKHLQDEPIVILHDPTSSPSSTNSNLSYILALTDPDAPSRENPKWSEMCHWIISNLNIHTNTISSLSLPRYGLTKRSTCSPNDVMPYKPPSPPPKTGKHRYVFLVFTPKNGTTEPLHFSKPEDRQHWGTGEEGGGVRIWAAKNGLVPVAGNFVYAENQRQ